MPVLSIDQLATLAANAGFTGDDLATAVAISLAETIPPGNPHSYNPEPGAKGGTPPGQGSYGLWQIYAKVHPEFDPAQLYDPQYNANAAYQVYREAGSSFRPWSTYGSGKYLAFLNSAQATVAAMQSPPPQSPDQTSTDQGAGIPPPDTGNGGTGSGGGSSSNVAWILGGIALLGIALTRG